MAEIPDPVMGPIPTGAPGGGGLIGGVTGGAGGGGGAAKSLFGGSSTIVQLLMWQVAGQVIAPILAPVAQQIADAVWSNATKAGLGVPLSPAEAALAVLRGDLTMTEAEAMASQSGVNTADFHTMYLNTGEPIAIEQALLLYRRGQIDDAQLATIVAQSRLRPEYLAQVKELRYAPMGAADAVAAAVQNQLPMAEAQTKAEVAGLDPQDFPTLVNTRGRPPGPAELLELVRRGVIPQTGTGPGVLSLDQGISESDIKDKWISAYSALLTYLPPPRTVTALLRAGDIDQATATKLFQDAGLSPDLAAAYVASAQHPASATHKELSQSAITSLYEDKLIDRPTAEGMLVKLGHTTQEADYLLQLSDLTYHQKTLNSAISRIHTLFVGRKLEAGPAQTALQQLGVPAAQVDELMTVWTLERADSLKILSETAIAAAWKYNLITDDQAMAMMQAHGYTPFDSWIFLAIHNGGTGPASQPPPDAIHGVL